MILVDTSVWIEHLRSGVPDLAEALSEAQVLVHPFVLGELACGNLRNRIQVLRLLRNLTVSPLANDDEVLFFIEARRLFGKGIGYIDAHLLAAATLAEGVRLWTRDRRLDGAAKRLGIAYRA